jgi:hypothetical protein
MAQLTKGIAPQVKTFEPGEDVATGIKSVRIPGHVGYMISSQGQSLLDVGDTADSSIISLAKHDWAMGYDTDPAVGRTSRREVLTQLARDHQLGFAPHFPYPGLGWVVSTDDHFGCFRRNRSALGRVKSEKNRSGDIEQYVRVYGVHCVACMRPADLSGARDPDQCSAWRRSGLCLRLQIPCGMDQPNEPFG